MNNWLSLKSCKDLLTCSMCEGIENIVHGALESGWSIKKIKSDLGGSCDR
jgi:hypothetical protein